MQMKRDVARLKEPMAALMLSFIILAALASVTFAAGGPSHLDKSKNPSGCAGCHKGHGKKGTAMLNTEKGQFCFSCHGLSSQGRGISVGADVSYVFNKRYRHPVVETSIYHTRGEELPEKNAAAPRHVACEDCHSVHKTEAGDTMKRVGGHKKGSSRERVAVDEYEVCYKCHSESANLPVNGKDLSDAFSATNESFHPVEATGRNHLVRSLKSPYDVGSRISCSDCHGNNDTFGPKGPHGSDYEFMLKKKYLTSESAEGPTVYELCYSCHDRDSILRNDSFKKHYEHVVFNHVPCSACHTAHGSRTNRHLIDLNTAFARPTPMPTYISSSAGNPLCMINCHVGGKDVLHDNAFYTSKRWP